MRRFHAALFVASLGLALPAQAQNCAGFTDVALDGFCAPVDWLRNRNITVGCTASQFCPDAVVTRKTMATFMFRLAAALDPIVVRVEQTGSATSLASPQVLCTSGPQTPTFARKFHVSGVFSATGAPDGDILFTPAMSVDGGAFFGLNQTNGTLSLRANEWHASPLFAVPQPDPFWNLQVGSTYTFGVLVQRANGSSANINDYRCHFAVELRNREGGTFPYDPN